MFIFCAVVTLGRGTLYSLATFAAVFIIAAVSITFAASCVGFWLFAPPYLYRRFCVPFAVPFALKRLQRSFYSVFRAVLSDPNFRRVLLYLLHRSSLSHGSKHGKTPLYGGGGPLGRGARGATDSPHNFLFFVPKNFFSGKFPLSSRFMPHFNAKIPLLWFLSLSAYQQDLVEARISSKKRHFSHFLLKDE